MLARTHRDVGPFDRNVDQLRAYLALLAGEGAGRRLERA